MCQRDHSKHTTALPRKHQWAFYKTRDIGSWKNRKDDGELRDWWKVGKGKSEKNKKLLKGIQCRTHVITPRHECVEFSRRRRRVKGLVVDFCIHVKLSRGVT